MNLTMTHTDTPIDSSLNTHLQRETSDNVASLKTLYDNYDYIAIIEKAPLLIASYQDTHNFAPLGNALFYYALTLYQNSNFIEAKEHLLKVLALSEKQLTTIELPTLYNHLGIIERNLSNYASARDWYKKALDYYSSHNNSRGTARIHNNIGMLHIAVGEFAKALEHFTTSYNIRKREGIKDNIAPVINNIGLIYLNIGRYSDAIEFFTEALEYEIEQSNKNGIAICYLNIGSVHEHLKNYDTALQYYRDSMLLRNETKNINGTAHCLMHIGNMFFSQKIYDDAILYFSEALTIKEKVEDKTGQANSLRMIGECYLKQEKYYQALQLFEQAEIIHISTNNAGEAQNVLLCKAQLFSIPETPYYNPQQAEALFITGLQYASDNSDEKMEMIIRKNLSELYEQQNRAEESLIQFKIFHDLSENIVGKEVLRKIVTTETEKKIEKIQKKHDDAIEKQKQLELLVKERTAQLDNLINKEHNFRHIHEAFVKHISHEFRTPLTAVTLGISVIEKMIDNSEEFSHGSQIKAFCKAMNTATASLRSILDSAQLLTQAQSSVLDVYMSVTDLTAIVLKYVPEWKTMMNPNQMIDIRITDYDILVHSNQALIEKMIHYILDNAMNYSPDNAIITVKTLIENGKGSVCIHNTNSYISPKEQSKIFDVFYRGVQYRELSHGGLGIGLTVCTMYALALNATIECKSDLEQGTEFILSFPLENT